MRDSLVKMVALLLLIVQGLSALTPGQIRCVSLVDHAWHDACDAHVHGHEHGLVDARSGHAHEHGSGEVSNDRESTRCHGHGVLGAASHPDDECGCHVHVPIPGDERVPSGPRVETPEMRALPLSVMASVGTASDGDPWRGFGRRSHPPGFGACDQVRALRSTRLMI